MRLPAGRHSAPDLGTSLPLLGKARGRWDQVSHGLTSISFKEKHFKAAENTHFSKQQRITGCFSFNGLWRILTPWFQAGEGQRAIQTPPSCERGAVGIRGAGSAPGQPLPKEGEGRTVPKGIFGPPPLQGMGSNVDFWASCCHPQGSPVPYHWLHASAPKSHPPAAPPPRFPGSKRQAPGCTGL